MKLLVFKLLIIFIIYIESTHSQQAYWNGTDYSNFMNSSNWDVGLVPSASSEIYINSNINVVLENGDQASIFSLSLGMATLQDVASTLLIQDGASLSASNLSYVYDKASLNIVNGTANFNQLTMYGSTKIKSGIFNANSSEVSNDIILENGISTIGGSFLMVGGSSLEITNAETILNSNLSFDKDSSMEIDSSSVKLSATKKLELKGFSKLTASNSSLESDGTINIISTTPVEITDSELSVNSISVLNVSPNTTISNSTLNFAGTVSFANVTFVNLVDVTLNILPNANVTINKQLSGKRLTLNIRGNLYFAKAISMFECDNCTINIDGKGLLRFNLFASANFTNTHIFNNANVFTAAKMNIPFGNTITNNGVLDYCADFFVDQVNNTEPIVKNTGKWMCNTPMHNLLTTPFLNTGEIQMTRGNVTFNHLRQTSGSIALIGGMLFANNTIELEAGALFGNGTIVGDLANQGLIGNQISLNTTDTIKIKGNLHQSGQIVLNINSNTSFSYLNISSMFNSSNADIIINISEDVPKNSSITVMNFDKFNGTIKSVTIRTFNPKTGESTSSNRCKYQSSRGATSLAVLVNNQDDCEGQRGDGGDKIPQGAIIGIVIGCIVAVSLIGLIIYYRMKIKLIFTKSYSSKLKMKTRS